MKAMTTGISYKEDNNENNGEENAKQKRIE